MKLLRIIAILLVALLQGLAFAHLLERPAKMEYEATFYVTLQQTLYAWWGFPRVGGILEPSAIVVTSVFAFLMRTSRRGFLFAAGAAVALLVAFPVVFYWLVAPANKVFLAASPAIAPPEWMAMRSQWETGHTLRFVLQFLALLLLVVPVVLDTPGRSKNGSDI